ncbi:hypothetical protein FQN50_002693 [Emmonsiellopsis sp. PD_5]|nr:hypothetical protein FQN50_002693 [Emmonsiellopsis sp. PD_5]
MVSEVYPPFLDFRNIPILRHKWCDIEREVLAVLRRFYTLTAIQETKIFNNMFAEQLGLEGFKDGLPRSSIGCQIHDLERLKHPVWVSVHSTPLEDINDEYDSARHFIKLAADGLGIDLRRRMDTGGAVQQHLYPGFQKLQSFFDIEITACPEHESSKPDTKSDFNNTISNLESPTRSSTNITILNPEPPARPSARSGYEPPARPSARSDYGPPARPSPRSSYIPRIVYRFYNADSSGVNTPTYFSAALWASGPSHIPHPCLTDERLVESMAKTHLSRYNIKSPFISTFETPLPSMHRMLAKGNNAAVAVIDLSMLDQSKIFSARAILKKDPLGEDITHGYGYDGRSEWLIWGDIPEQCIICSIPEEKFQHITAMNDDISHILQVKDIQAFKVNRRGLKQRLSSSPTEIEYASGEVVGKFLRLVGLPEEYGDVVAGGISQAWQFCWTNELGYKQYLRGVHAAYERSTSITPNPGLVDDDTDDDIDDEINGAPDDEANNEAATRSYEGCIESCDDSEMENGGCDDTYDQTQDYYYDDGQDNFMARLGEELRQSVAEADFELDDDNYDDNERTHNPPHMLRLLEPGNILGKDAECDIEWVHVMDKEAVDNGAVVRIFEFDRSRVNQAMG